MDTNIFAILLNLFMCSDPWPTTDEEHDALESYLTSIAKSKGYSDWIEAYHTL